MISQFDQSAFDDDHPASGKSSSGKELPRLYWKLGGVSLLAALFASQIYYLLSTDPVTDPSDLLETALARLDEGENVQARELAKQLEASNSHSPSFSGGTEFVLGMVAFREALQMDPTGREQRYILAANYLREADKRNIVEERRPEWAHALGVSLSRIGLASEARPLLETAVETFPAGRFEASLLLIEIYLDSGERELLEKALRLSDDMIALPGLPLEEQDRAYLQRAQVLLALERNEEAEAALRHVSDATHGNHGTLVLRSLTAIAEGKFAEALEMLGPVANDVGLDHSYSRQACYLMGVCARKLGDLEAAVNYFERTATRYERSHESLAASLWAGDALRQLGRNEEALESYGQALRMVRSPETFRNRWVTIEQFRKSIVDAWNAWIAGEHFADAIALAEMMTPLFPRDEAYEFAALANQRRAESLQAQYDQLPLSEQARRKPELQRRWIQSGKAYARLALARMASANYPDALWTSADHYLRGQDFTSGVNQLTRFIATNPPRLVPQALVRRGDALMNLNQLDSALEHFQRVLQEYPTAPAAFEAKYLLGVCHLQRNERDVAEEVWRSILNSSELTPKAEEWRKALFSLGKLLFQKAEARGREIVAAETEGRTADAEQLRGNAFILWNDVIGNLEQYLDRYPTSAEAAEARYMLAHAWRNSAEFLEQKLELAETDSARTDIRRKMNERLENAVREFSRLQSDLRSRYEADRLDSLGVTLLRNSYFEIPHTLYKLGRYEEAISAYGSAVARYQLQAETLTAYVQMANCYERLGRPAESRSMLEQAKVLLNQIPDQAFESPSTSLNRQEWNRWLDWAMSLHRT